MSVYWHFSLAETSFREGVGSVVIKVSIKRGGYLGKYKWSSLAGYINKSKRQEFVDYDLVLEEYGGDNKKGRRASYSDIISIDALGQMDVKSKIVGQSIIGSEDFIEDVLDRYLKKKPDLREQLSLRELHGLRVKDEIIDAVKKETGKDLSKIKKSKGTKRNVLMDSLYRVGGIKGAEIGNLLEVDYSTVSQGRKRLKDNLKKNKKLRHLVDQIEKKLSR